MSGNLFNGLFWLIVLVLLSWWIACFCFVPYVIVSVITPCIPGLKPLADILMAGVMFPYKCSDNMVHQRSYNSVWVTKHKIMHKVYIAGTSVIGNFNTIIALTTIILCTTREVSDFPLAKLFEVKYVCSSHMCSWKLQNLRICFWGLLNVNFKRGILNFFESYNEIWIEIWALMLFAIVNVFWPLNSA